MALKKVDKIIDKYQRDDSHLVMVLQDIQEEYNFVPAAALEQVAERLEISLSRVYNIATFYSSFSMEERGKHLITLCNGTTCHLRGFGNLRNEISRQLGIGKGQTTKDKMFTLEVIACLGACALAPVMAIDGKCYGNMTPEKITAILKSHRKMEKARKSGK